MSSEDRECDPQEAAEIDAVVRCLKTMFLIKKRPLEKKQTTTLCEIGEANSTRPG